MTEITLSNLDPETALRMERDIGRLEGRMEGVATSTIENTKQIGSLAAKVSWMLGASTVVAGVVSVLFNVLAKKMGLS